jgi:hypothetical protein
MAAKVTTWFMNEEEEVLVGDCLPAPCKIEKIVKKNFMLSERKVVVRFSEMEDGW